MPTTPNPGSREAQEAGCICAVLDNNHGKHPPFPPDGWWITQGCPVHFALGAQGSGFEVSYASAALRRRSPVPPP